MILARLRYFFQNAFWINFDQAVRAGTDVCIGILLARTFPKDVFGDYQLLLSVLMVASLASLSGFNGSLLRALARGKDGTLAAVTRLSSQMSVIGVLIVFLLGVFWYDTRSSQLGIGLMLSAGLVPFFHILRRWQVVLHARQAFRRRAIYNGILSAILLVTMLGSALVLRLPIVSLFLVYIVVQVCAHAMFYRTVVRDYILNGEIESGWRQSGFKLLLSEVFGVMYAHADKLVLAFWFGPETLAVYAVAVMGGESLKILYANVIAIYLPLLHQISLREIVRWVRQFGLLWIVVCVVSLFFAWMTIPILLPLLFSSKYVGSVVYAQWYLLVVPFHSLATMLGQLLIKLRQESWFTVAMVLAGGVNLLTYGLLIPRVGIAGAVIGSVGYYFVMAALFGVFVFTHLANPPVPESEGGRQ